MPKNSLARRLASGLLLPLLLVAVVSLDRSSVDAQCVPGWDGPPGVPGADGPVFDVEIYDDGTGPALFAGGDFTTIGGVSAPGLAKWNGTTWTAIGAGVIGFGPVRTLEAFDDGTGSKLFVGGEFFGTAGNLIALCAAWDGTTWHDLQGGLEGTIVSDLQIYDPGTGPQLYAGGSFVTAGGVFAEGIAAWNGTTWSPLGGGTMNGTVYSLAVHDTGTGTGPLLYLGGSITNVSGFGVSNIAGYNGAGFVALAGGVDAPVRAMASFAGQLVVGGEFLNAGGTPANRIASWDGAAWFDLLGADAVVWTMQPATIDGTDLLVVGGAFTNIGGGGASRIATWDGFGFAPLGVGTDADVLGLAMHDGVGGAPTGLYVSGAFTFAGGTAAAGVARYDTCVPPPAGNLFERGDVNADGALNIADAITTLNLLFGSGVTIPCDEAADGNDDGTVNIADAVFLLAYLFTPGSPDPAPPFGSCGVDADGDAVGCDLPSPAC